MRYFALVEAVLAAGIVAVTIESAPTNASDVRAIGTLTCTLVLDSTEDTKGQSTALNCGFKPTQDGAEEKYVGTVSMVQQGQGHRDKLVLMWSVLAPAETKMKAGLLAQSYMPAAGASQQPRVLVGKTNAAIALQLETNNGDASAIISSLDLKLSATPA